MFNVYLLLPFAERPAQFLYPHSPKGEGCILFYLCPSFRLSFRPSKIFFVTFFSVTVDGRNLIFDQYTPPPSGSGGIKTVQAFQQRAVAGTFTHLKW
jgi:hypothetical protein